ncbi:MAG: amino acid ABC transporter permease [Acidimicrobiales bacterium]|jgi:polar amino acid transport system permease protein|nr:amino acid ABC transporter permease [Acidimicrobiales bacterium]
MTQTTAPHGVPLDASRSPLAGFRRMRGREFQWWLAVMMAIIGWMLFQVIVSDEYREAWTAIKPGMQTTLYLTVLSFVVAVPLGLIIGMGRLSKNRFLNTISQVYIEFMRGMPMIVWIFIVHNVATPEIADLLGIRTRSIPILYRGAAALCLFYAAFIAEVFRAGIQSVDPGQVEAAKATGLSRYRTQRHIVLPQALRNALPALGNDFIALMKDTSLLSVIAVHEVTQQARIYSGSSFRFREAFFVLAVIYVTLTLVLSLLLQWWERRLEIPGNDED